MMVIEGTLIVLVSCYLAKAGAPAGRARLDHNPAPLAWSLTKAEESAPELEAQNSDVKGAFEPCLPAHGRMDGYARRRTLVQPLHHINAYETIPFSMLACAVQSAMALDVSARALAGCFVSSCRLGSCFVSTARLSHRSQNSRSTWHRLPTHDHADTASSNRPVDVLPMSHRHAVLCLSWAHDNLVLHLYLCQQSGRREGQADRPALSGHVLTELAEEHLATSCSLLLPQSPDTAMAAPPSGLCIRCHMGEHKPRAQVYAALCSRDVMHWHEAAPLAHDAILWPAARAPSVSVQRS